MRTPEEIKFEIEELNKIKPMLIAISPTFFDDKTLNLSISCLENNLSKEYIDQLLDNDYHSEDHEEKYSYAYAAISWRDGWSDKKPSSLDDEVLERGE